MRGADREQCSADRSTSAEPQRCFINGAESLVRTVVGGGVNVRFANPGANSLPGRSLN
jgi:hypothetical protein